MPVYTFLCASCSASRDLMAGFEEAEALELVCFRCGGGMTRAPVLSVNVIGPAIRAEMGRKQQQERAYFAKACGHRYACRCGVRLSKENPFKQDIRAAHGFTDED